jgi:hypothetical protein
MSEFAPKWLALREPADHTARAHQLVEPLVQALSQRLDARAVLQVADLGAGTGSNFRYLAPRLPYDQLWRCYESDIALIEFGRRELLHWGERNGFETRVAPGQVALGSKQHTLCVQWHRVDLQTAELATVVERCDLLTCSALLDLVSATWLERLVIAMSQLETIGLFALTYDGAIEWDPALDDDPLVAEALNRDQHTDKGFGPALGPNAAVELSRLCAQYGFALIDAPSPWHLGPERHELHDHLLSDLHDLMIARQGDALRAGDWHRQRQSLRATGALLTVGHRDQLIEPHRTPSGS